MQVFLLDNEIRNYRAILFGLAEISHIAQKTNSLDSKRLSEIKNRVTRVINCKAGTCGFPFPEDLRKSYENASNLIILIGQDKYREAYEKAMMLRHGPLKIGTMIYSPI